MLSFCRSPLPLTALRYLTVLGCLFLLACGQPTEQKLTFVGTSGTDGSDGDLALADAETPTDDAAQPADIESDSEDAAAGQDAAVDAETDAQADAQVDAQLDATVDAASDSAADTADDAQVDAAPDTAPDTAPDAEPDTVADTAAPDTQADTAPDTAIDTATDTQTDAGQPPLTGPAPCMADADCPASAAHCAADIHACVPCLTSAQCSSGSVCIGHQCAASKACKSDLDCKATTQVCGKSEGACVDCNSAADCGTNQACSQFKCVAAKPCKSSKDCDGVCNTTSGICVACLGAEDCKAEEFCSAGTCLPDVCSGPQCSGASVYGCASDGGAFLALQSCADSNPCTDDACTAGVCAWQTNSALCSDGDACTTGDACKGGKCGAGSALGCDDNNACTKDTCDPTSGCKNTPNPGAGCSDDDPCTVTDLCNASGKCAGAPMACDDGNPCTTDACKGGSCVMSALPGPCSDGSACTVGDSCQAGKCAPGQVKVCDDGNPCTDDSCNPSQGCQSAPNTKACSDGNACTQNDVCGGGTCAGKPMDCNDSNVCTADKCDGGACVFVPAAGACSDGDGCTISDACQNGKCAGAPLVCDDGNACTTDSCTAGACKFVANTLGCDDKNACTTGDICSSGQCLGTPKVCSDGNSCTDDACVAGLCTFAPNTASCGAADSCSQCAGGTCKAGGGSGFDALTSMGSAGELFRAVVPLGNDVLAVGETDNSGGNGTDGMVALIGSDGKAKWTKKYGFADKDAFFDAANTLLGTVVVGTSVNTTVPGNGEDAWVIVIDGSGNLLMSKTYGGAPNEWPERVTVLSDGILLVGRSTSGGIATAWLARLDFMGNLVWSKTYSNYDKFTACAVTPTGAFVCHGTGPAANKGTDAYFVNIAANGDPGTGSPHGSASNDDAGGLIAVGDGTYVALQTYADGVGGSKLAMQKLKGDGTLAWSKQVEAYPTESHIPRSITAVPGVGYAFVGGAATGTQTSIGGTNVSGLGDQGVVGLVSLDGSLLWITGMGGTGIDQMRGVTAAQGGIVAVGYYSYANMFGGTSGDAWQVRLSLGGQIGCQCTANAGCGDNKSCTSDLCTAGRCEYWAQLSGTACGSNGLCDSGGTCVQPVCGNGKCEAGESAGNCPTDCKTHPCDNICGGTNATYNCFCDAACKTQGDCCTATGSKSTSCAGSSCTVCQ